jgi:hypothetical protein
MPYSWRSTAGKRSRHLSLRLFFVDDQKAKGNLSIEFCPKDKMTGDYMSKLMHGQNFKDFGRQVMNLPNLPFAAHIWMAAVVISKK